MARVMGRKAMVKGMEVERNMCKKYREECLRSKVD